MKNEKVRSNDNVDWRYLSWDAVDEPEATLMRSFGTGSRHTLTGPGLTKPTLWSRRYKSYLDFLGLVANFSTTYAGGSYTSAVDPMANYWRVSNVAILVGVTVYTVAFGLAPMVLAPFSEINVTQLYVGMLLARVLVGIASSTFAVVIVGIVADIHTEERDRYRALSLFTTGAMFGTGFGPLVSAFIVQNTHWRWLFGVLGMFCLVMVAVIIVTFRETRDSVILSWKAQALNRRQEGLDSDSAEQGTAVKRESTQIRWKVEADEERQSIVQVIGISVQRPMHLLLTEPVVFWFSCWGAFAWSIMYAMLIVVPYTFQTVYGFDFQTSSAVFAAMCVATLLMALISRHHDRLAEFFVAREKLDSPEGMLYPVAVEAVLLPIGLFWYGWGTQTSAHWIVPTLGLGCATMGMFSVYLAVFAYLATAYKEYASSANAAQSMFRMLLGGAFPLFAQAMVQRLGFGGAFSLLGGIGVVLTFVPWVLIWFGPRIRARSKIAYNDKS
ncbi:hypothetical protein LTR05_005700 [Lithohypha guttulata]|uniref:Major facilitator superfamily (MFS) profile domain-containing protein n=1 Tax=Lithohypha guttulata TaxID=1690604 RepID=A0AAN7SYT3_9EURO|nr:hypothetical protein LTR05_005700 [Lithohypha guttulata]